MAAVEFALVLPVLLILVLGIMEYGYYFFVRLNVINAAREGARVGVTRETDAEAKAVEVANNYLQHAGLCNTCASATLNDPDLTVSVNVPYTAFTTFFPFMPTSVQASAVMRWELAP